MPRQAAGSESSAGTEALQITQGCKTDRCCIRQERPREWLTGAQDTMSTIFNLITGRRNAG